MANFANDLVESVVVGRQFDLTSLRSHVMAQYRATEYRDVLHIELEQGEVWIFDYGVYVFWGVTDELKTRLLNELQEKLENALEEHEKERFTFVVAADRQQMREECLMLSSDSYLERLAASHAMAQSVKLGHFELMAQRVIQENEYIPRKLADSGKIPLSRKALAKLRGTLFSVKSDIMLNFNLLDTPEFFWSYPELEPTYNLVAHYLDIVSRINVLNKKLETIHELLDMLANEQNHKHSSILEWIVIILIAVEVVLFFWH